MSELISAIAEPSDKVMDVLPVRKPIEVMADVTAAQETVITAKAVIAQAAAAKALSLKELVSRALGFSGIPEAPKTPYAMQFNVLIRVGVDAEGNVVIQDLGLRMDPE